MDNRYLWRKINDTEAQICRVYSMTAKVQIPDRIEGYIVRELSDYCFAPNGHVTLDLLDTGEIPGTKEIGGKLLEAVELPKTLKRIGNYCFYDCRELETLQVGNELETIGGDVFMNCFRLTSLVIWGSGSESSGLKQLVSQIPSSIEVSFSGKTGLDARLLYPEYYELYDEIAPAHVFGRKITGEGFRARQCFLDGKVDFEAYDKIFPQACVDETQQTLMTMAMVRLCYPMGLNEDAKKLYQEYIKENDEVVAVYYCRRKDLDSLCFLCETKLLSQSAIAKAIQIASEDSWAEGAVELMKYKEKEKKNRYSFDDF